MRTSKPISTISFNTLEFLIFKLSYLLEIGVFSFWAFMEHKPEDDEGGKKQHFHVFAIPSKIINTDDIRKEFLEDDPDNDKPRGTLLWKTSKFDSWYMYALHDSAYLASKGQSRKYHYTHDMIITSDDDDLTCMARSIDLITLSPYMDMRNAQGLGMTFAEYFNRGTIPIQQVRLYQTAWDLLKQCHTNRNTKTAHDMDIEIDKITGEIIG